VTNPDALLEVLAYLVTAARTQLDEAAEYAPMRMLTAGQRLGEAMRPDASGPVVELLDALRSIPPTATPTSAPDRYVEMLDDLCRVLAASLQGLDGGQPPHDSPPNAAAG